MNQNTNKEDRIRQTKKLQQTATCELQTNMQLMYDTLLIIAEYEYSELDSLLIAYNLGTITELKTYKEWNELGRYIAKGEQGITLLDYNQGREVLFDYTQTRAVEKGNNYSLPKKDLIQTYQQKLTALLSSGVRIMTTTKKSFTHQAPAYYNGSDNTLYIDRTVPLESLYPAVSKELALAHLDRVYSKSGSFSRETYDDIAKMTSYVVCLRNNVENNDIGIPPNFGTFSERMIEEYLRNIRMASKEIQKRVDYYYQNGRAMNRQPERLPKVQKASVKTDEPSILDTVQEKADKKHTEPLKQERKSIKARLAELKNKAVQSGASGKHFICKEENIKKE